MPFFTAISASGAQADAIFRTNATPNVAPTALELPAPANNDFAIVVLTDGRTEYYTYNGSAWNQTGFVGAITASPDGLTFAQMTNGAINFSVDGNNVGSMSYDAGLGLGKLTWPGIIDPAAMQLTPQTLPQRDGLVIDNPMGKIGYFAYVVDTGSGIDELQRWDGAEWRRVGGLNIPIDPLPTTGSANAVSSGGVADALTVKLQLEDVSNEILPGNPAPVSGAAVLSVLENRLTDALGAGQIWVGDENAQATQRTISGEASIDEVGLVTLSGSAVVNKVLTGINTVGLGAVVDTDTILQGIGKLQATKLDASAAPTAFTPNGQWNATTNTPNMSTPTNRVNGSSYYAYFISTSGTQNLGSGPQLFEAGGSVYWYSTTVYSYVPPATTVPLASTTVAGRLEVATTAETEAGLGTPDSLGATLVPSIAATEATYVKKTLANGSVFIGNASNVATAQTLSGDATVSNAGVVSVIAASETQAGKVELATTAETETGTDTVRAITPAAGEATYLKKSIINAKGDLLVGTADNTVARLPVGNNTYAPIANSADPTGITWTNIALPYNSANSYVTGDRIWVLNRAVLARANANIASGTSFSWGTSGATWSPEIVDSSKWQGVYNALTAYVTGDIVASSAAGGLYVSQGASTGQALTTGFWQPLRGDYGVLNPMAGTNGIVPGARGLVPTPVPGDENRALFGDGTYKTINASGDAITRAVTQTAHGLAVRQAVYVNSSGAYVVGRADTDATSDVVGVVSAVAGANAFTLLQQGYLSGFTGLIPGQGIFLSDATAGLLTQTEPTAATSWRKPVGVAVSATEAWIDIQPGTPVTGQTAVAVSGQSNSIANAQTTSSTTFVDVAGGSFILPVAGTYSLHYSVSVQHTTGTDMIYFRLVNNAGVEVPGSIGYGQAFVASGRFNVANETQVSVTGQESYRLQWRVNTGTATLRNATGTSPESANSTITWQQIGGTPVPMSLAGEYGANYAINNGQSLASATFTDVTNGAFSLPTPGVWEVDFTLGAAHTLAGNAVRFQVLDPSGAIVPNSSSGALPPTANLPIITSWTTQITTASAGTYRLQWSNASGTGTASIVNNANALSGITWRKISGFTPTTGSTVDTLAAWLAADQAVASGTAGQLISLTATTGNIPVVGGVVSLTAGKSYRITTTIDVRNMTGAGASVFNIGWGDNAASVSATAGGLGSGIRTGVAGNIASFGTNFTHTWSFDYTPTSNQTIKLCAWGSGSNYTSATIASQNTHVVIQQLGSTATTTTLANRVRLTGSTNTPAPNNTNSILALDTTVYNVGMAVNLAQGLVTIGQSGLYHIVCEVNTQGFAASAAGAIIAVNNVQVAQVFYTVSGGTVSRSQASDVRFLNAGDTVRVQGYQNSGSPQNMQANTLCVTQLPLAF